MSKWKETREAEIREQQEAEERQKLEDSEKELASIVEESELLQKFKERHAKESKRRQDVTDSNYYFVVCFSNNDQLKEFCDQFGLNPDLLYMDGKYFAKNVNKALQTPDTDFPRVQAGSKDYRDRAMPIK